MVAIDLGDHLLHHKRTGHDIASLLYVSMLLSLPEEWYPRYLLADGSMPYLAHIDSIEDLQECVAILTPVFLAGTSLRRDLSQSPATSQDTGTLVHPPPTAGFGRTGLSRPKTKPCCSLHSNHGSTHPPSVKLRVGTTTGSPSCIVLRRTPSSPCLTQQAPQAPWMIWIVHQRSGGAQTQAAGKILRQCDHTLSCSRLSRKSQGVGSASQSVEVSH